MAPLMEGIWDFAKNLRAGWDIPSRGSCIRDSILTSLSFQPASTSLSRPHGKFIGGYPDNLSARDRLSLPHFATIRRMADLEPHYAQIPVDMLPALPRNPIHVVLDNLRSAYNVGSIFRTADAGAVAHIHLCGMSAHPPHKKLEKTALGAFEYVPWTYHERTSDCVRALKKAGIPVVALEVTDDAVSMDDFTWPEPVAIVFGNEVDGINEKNLGRCDAVVKIPMAGHKNSVNVATAFGIVLYNILSRSRAAS